MGIVRKFGEMHTVPLVETFVVQVYGGDLVIQVPDGLDKVPVTRNRFRCPQFSETHHDIMHEGVVISVLLGGDER